MGFRVVTAKERYVCTCICSYHHNANTKRRCALFIEAGQPMAENPDTMQNRRRCMPCAEAAGVVAAVSVVPSTTGG